MVDVYGPSGGASAMAANGFLRYTLGAVFPLFAIQSKHSLRIHTRFRSHSLTLDEVYERLGIGWATSLLGFLSLLMLPIPWILYKWGPDIRKRSQWPMAMK
jgi:hypothetical protein